jgi:hypothetical protein
MEQRLWKQEALTLGFPMKFDARGQAGERGARTSRRLGGTAAAAEAPLLTSKACLLSMDMLCCLVALVPPRCSEGGARKHTVSCSATRWNRPPTASAGGPPYAPAPRAWACCACACARRGPGHPRISVRGAKGLAGRPGRDLLFSSSVLKFCFAC